VACAFRLNANARQPGAPHIRHVSKQNQAHSTNREATAVIAKWFFGTKDYIFTAIGFSQGNAVRILKLFERIALVGTVKVVPTASPATIDAAQ
jgi:hypothetical protein